MEKRRLRNIVAWLPGYDNRCRSVWGQELIPSYFAPLTSILSPPRGRGGNLKKSGSSITPEDLK
jgi:hypothetical protein